MINAIDLAERRREQALEERRARVLEQVKTLEMGAPIAVEIGSTENEMIMLDTYFVGLTRSNRISYIRQVNSGSNRPCVIVANADPEDVRVGGITGQRASLFES